VLVSLAATLDAYLAGQPQRVPLYRLLAESAAKLESRAASLAEKLREAGLPAQVVTTQAVLGGGTTPDQTIPSAAVALPDDPTLARQLRLGEPPVVPRQERGQLLLDLRAVFPEQDPALLAATLRAWEG